MTACAVFMHAVYDHRSIGHKKRQRKLSHHLLGARTNQCLLLFGGKDFFLFRKSLR